MATRPLDPALDATVAPQAADGRAGTMAQGSQLSQPDGGGGPSAGLRPGIVIAETYEITRLLGQGGMGAVWEAKHLRLPGKRVVVKVLLFGATDATVLARFRREAEIGSRLGHPNIVQVIDFNTLPDGTPYIVLELLQGESLASRLLRGPLPLEQVTSIVTQVGSALAAAHREGVVHRDLKPDNVFLCPTDLGGEVRDVVKVLDFGISKIRGSNTVLTQDAALLGTPQYMAPEQATGRNDEIDARTDVFAFGAMTFEMLAGKPPFTGDTLAAVIHAIVYTPTPPLAAVASGKDVPPAIIAAVERAMEKNRDARFPDVNSFVKAVTSRSLAAAPTVQATRQESAAPTERISREPSRAPVFIAFGIAVLASIGFTVWKLKPREPEEAALPSQTTAQTSLPTPPSASAPTTKPVASTDAPTPARAEKADEAKADAEPAKPPAKESPRAVKSTAAKGTAAALSPEAARDLDEAEAALEAGKPGEAVRLAQHSLYAQKSSRAYALITRARCAQGDLGNAKANLTHVAPRDRSQVVRACGKLGVELH
jgi:eukaryotic-like serine/threonine-protein kinase